MSDIKLKNVLDWNKSFCILPFVHKHLDIGFEHKLCCHSKYQIDNNRVEQIQKDMLDNIPIPECAKCVACEKNKNYSERQLITKKWFREYPDIAQQTIKNPYVYSYDLRYSNLCNLRCQTCGPLYSSSWAKFFEQKDIYKTWDTDWVDINPDAKSIYMAGGEPFMVKSFSKVLNNIENKNCEIIINTNATVLTDHMLDALRPFTNVCFVLSIDGTGAVIEKIRTGCSWNQIQNNIKTLTKELNPSYMVNTVLQKDNLDNIPDLAQWIDEQSFNIWHVTVLSQPDQYSYKHYKGTLYWPKSIWKQNCVVKNIQVQNALRTVYKTLTA